MAARKRRKAPPAPAPPAVPPDVEVADHGSVVLLHPRTDAAREWFAEHLPEDATRVGEAVACEARFMPDIVAGMEGDDLVVRSA